MEERATHGYGILAQVCQNGLYKIYLMLLLALLGLERAGASGNRHGADSVEQRIAAHLEAQVEVARKLGHFAAV